MYMASAIMTGNFGVLKIIIRLSLSLKTSSFKNIALLIDNFPVFLFTGKARRTVSLIG